MSSSAFDPIDDLTSQCLSVLNSRLDCLLTMSTYAILDETGATGSQLLTHLISKSNNKINVFIRTMPKLLSLFPTWNPTRMSSYLKAASVTQVLSPAASQTPKLCFAS